MKITLEQLRDAHACLEQRLKFEEFFGQEVEVTPALCEALAEEFDWPWAAKMLLPSVLRKEFYKHDAKEFVEFGNELQRLLNQHATESIDYSTYLDRRLALRRKLSRDHAKLFANLYNRSRPQPVPTHDFDDSETFALQHPEA